VAFQFTTFYYVKAGKGLSQQTLAVNSELFSAVLILIHTAIAAAVVVVVVVVVVVSAAY
jgi:hypothetical protein